MQLTTLFALFCGAIITIHFLDMLAERIRSKKRKNLSKTVRKDWYCFFSPERLVGHKNSATQSEFLDNRQNKAREDRRRRVQEQRRRLVLKS